MNHLQNKMTSHPRVSVLLPVYNGEQYLLAAIESVLQQTFTDFELIIINDGSSDRTAALLDGIDDPRVRVVHQKNMGLALTLNRAIDLARGEYLARQDADDVSLPKRFERQVEFLDTHPQHALVGSWTRILEEDRETNRGHQHPCDNGELQYRLLFDSFFVHSSVMIRRSVLAETGPYPTDPERNPPEDFDLWSRIARNVQVANQPEVLQLYRELPGSISRSKAELLQARAVKIAVENLHYATGGQVAVPVLHDLAALVRRAEHLISAKPDWKEIRRALELARKHLVARFPEQEAQINKGKRVVHLSVKTARLSRHPLGPYLARMRRLWK